VETLELKIIWVNGTHATVNLARRIRGQRRQKRADGKAGTEETKPRKTHQRVQRAHIRTRTRVTFHSASRDFVWLRFFLFAELFYYYILKSRMLYCYFSLQRPVEFFKEKQMISFKLFNSLYTNINKCFIYIL